jgi:hypothetical protein
MTDWSGSQLNSTLSTKRRYLFEKKYGRGMGTEALALTHEVFNFKT